MFKNRKVTNEEKKQRQEIKYIALDQVNSAKELGSKFFFHWSILAGATITLTITALVQLKIAFTEIEGLFFVKIALFFLIASLILSSLRNYLAAIGLWMSGQANLQRLKGEKYSSNLLFRYRLSFWQKCIEATSIGSYIVALFFLYAFISAILK